MEEHVLLEKYHLSACTERTAAEAEINNRHNRNLRLTFIRDLIKGFYNANYPGERHEGIGFIYLKVEGVNSFFAAYTEDGKTLHAKAAKYRPHGLLEAFFVAYFDDRQKKDGPTIVGIMMLGRHIRPIIADDSNTLQITNWE